MIRYDFKPRCQEPGCENNSSVKITRQRKTRGAYGGVITQTLYFHYCFEHVNESFAPCFRHKWALELMKGL